MTQMFYFVVFFVEDMSSFLMVFNQIYYLLTENYLGAMIEYYKKFLLNFIIFF
jgi:hypothetical protein